MEFSVAAIKAMELAQGQAEINTALDGSLPKELPNVSQKLDGSLPLESEGAQHENHELQGDLPGETGEGAPEELVDVEIDTELSGVEQGLSSWDKLASINAAGEKVYTFERLEDRTLLNGALPENSTILDKPGTGEYANYQVDGHGRIESLNLPELKRYPGVRDVYQQSRCCELKEGLSGDDAGHILGRQFGGPSEQFNYLPMDSEVNRHGEFRNLERRWEKALDAGSSITDIRIAPEYEGSSKRPTGFEASYRVDGQQQYTYIDNSPRGEAA